MEKNQNIQFNLSVIGFPVYLGHLMANLLWFPLQISSHDHLGSLWTIYLNFWHLGLKETAVWVSIVF